MSGTSPDREHARAELRRMMEAAIADLPEPFRLVFVLREIEGMDVETVSETLGLLLATVKTRHRRARRRLQQALAPDVKEALSGTFPFAGADCGALTERVVRAFCR
jgi:RNA polymerase sigma-70 factor (ECF subfamily)